VANCRFPTENQQFATHTRELRNAVERSVLLSRGATLRKDDLPHILFLSSATLNGTLPEHSTSGVTSKIPGASSLPSMP